MPVQQPVKLVGTHPSAASCEFLGTRCKVEARSHCRCSLPPSEEGEWWELTDDSRDGMPYYYQTKTGETVWERPDAFIIPLGILQVRDILATRRALS